MSNTASTPFARNRAAETAPLGPLTLAVDCGGGSIKSAVCAVDGTLVSAVHRVPVTYPFPVIQWLDVVGSLLDQANAAGFAIARLSVGLPGMIRGGVVVYTPHYIRSAGPHTPVDPGIAGQWNGLRAAPRLKERFGVPAIVVNDSEMHGAALITGSGLEVTLTFGTGLGSSHFLDGQLQAHLELSHAQFIEGTTYDQYIGEHVRLQIGDDAWSSRVVEVVRALYPVFRWDAVFVGGGNAHNLTPHALETLTQFGPSVRVVANRVALSGAAKLWD